MKRRWISTALLFCVCAPAFADVQYKADQARDPFGATATDALQANARTNQSSPLKLEGIIWSPSRSAAVINGKLVEVGEWIAQAQVVSIDKESVKMRYKENIFILTKKGNPS